MHQSVEDAFITFTTKFEGKVKYMYLDVKKLVTIGIGNLIDPIPEALQLPFVFKIGGSSASPTQIEHEWDFIKKGGTFMDGGVELAKRGHTAAKGMTDLMLNDEDINELVNKKLHQFENTLKSGNPPEFASFDQWPADAQLGLLSMAWAAGPAFAQGGKFKKFRQAVANGDWDEAAKESHLSEINNPGLKPRNRANEILFTNAARVIEQGLPLDVLQYPLVLTPGIEETTSDGWPLLQEGSSRPVVSALQHLLREQGHLVNTNGVFDAATTMAVKAFQTTQNLGADGIVGKNTWLKLVVVCRLNDSGEAVQAIQDRLFFWDAGLVFDNPGIFDLLTDEKVREVQASQGLVVDGIVGPNTWKALLAL